MKIKIISALKTKYANRGFGDKAFDGVAEYLSKTVTEESQIEDAVTGVDGLLKTFQGEVDNVRREKTTLQKELDELKAKGDPAPAPPKEDKKPEGDDLDAKLQAMFDAKVKPIQDELAAYKAKEAASARQNSITAKAKELGIPEERIKQGFVIAEDADDAAIGEYLSGIATYEKSRELPFGNRFPLQSSDKITDEEAKAIADKMIV